MDKENRIGIVTVLYNSTPVLEDYYRTLSKQTYQNFILYCVDNASTDNSIDNVKKISEKYKINTKFLPQKENFGVAKGNNIGIKNALKDECKYILLSNNDIILENNCIERLLAGMDTYNASLSIPKIYYWNTDNILWQAGGFFDIPRCLTIHYGYNRKDSPKYDVARFVGYAPTCFMLIKSDIFSQYGLMDEKYFVYYDDSDFIWRVVHKGKEKMIYLPDSILWHKVSFLTKNVSNDFCFKFLNRNKIYFVRKNYNILFKMCFLMYTICHFILKDIVHLDKKHIKMLLNCYKEGYILGNE